MPKPLELPLLSMDTEGTGLDLRHGAKPFFIATCSEELDIQYWEADVDPLTRQPIWQRDQLQEVRDLVATHTMVLQNPRYDVRALNTVMPLEWPWQRTYDTLLAGHLLISNQPHDLATMAMIYLRVNIKPLEDKLEAATKSAIKIAKQKYPDWHLAKADRPDMPSAKGKTWKYDSWLPRAIAQAEDYSEEHDWWHVLANYTCGDGVTPGDVDTTLLLFKKQRDILKDKSLWDIYKCRLELLDSLYKMETNGLTMSRSRTEELYARLAEEAEEYKQQCLEIVDHEIEDLPVNGVSNDLKYAVFDKLGLKSNKKTPKGKPSMDKFVLDHWIATLPENSKQRRFVKGLKSYRKRKTAVGYMDSYQKFWLQYTEPKTRSDLRGGFKTILIPIKDCMIVYPSFNPTGTDTLRFSSQNPNAQQVSKQEEANTRYCFGPAPGREWWSIDFSNLELRIPAYEANEEEMVKLFERPDDPPYYGSYHMMIFDTLHPDLFIKHGMKCKEEYDDTWYQWTKNGNFAVQYGAVEKSGTADRAYHVRGAQHKIMSRFTRIKQLSQSWIKYASKHGYIETMPDKTVDPHRGYPLYCTRTKWNKILETVPLSYHVQGTAMWVTMKAMIRCQKYLDKHSRDDGKLVCQVHDEMIFDFPKGVGKKHVLALAKLMEKSGDDIGVPLGTTIKYHPVTWAKSEEQ